MFPDIEMINHDCTEIDRFSEEYAKTFGEEYLAALNKSTPVGFTSGNGACQVREFDHAE